jgi:hypothetical protein
MAIRKPSSIGSTTNPPSGSTLIKASGGTFVLKMTDFDFDHSTHSVEETTGDGDADPVFEHNQLQVGSYVLYGWMVAGAAMGLANLKSSSNPGTFKVKLDSTSDAGAFHNVTLLVRNIRGKWKHVGVGIRVAIYGIITSTTPSSIEASS